MISRKTDNFTGFIIQDEEKIYFHAENKIFNFISEGVGIFAEAMKKTLTPTDSFLHGYTTDGYQVALFADYDKREISANYKLKPGVYVMSKANLARYDMTMFQAIEFVGGTLNNLYEQQQIKTTYSEEQKCYIKTYPELRRVYDVRIRDYDCKLTIKNVPSLSSPSEMDLVMRYEFPEEVPLATIKLLYNVTIDICRFMTNRKNVGFRDVKLSQLDDETGKWNHFADAFIDYKYDHFTNKSYKTNILIEHLDNCIEELYRVVSSNNEGKSTYLFDFYADTDTDYTVLSDNKVKNICSSVECELDFVKNLKNDENKNLAELIKQVKRLIKEHRKSENKLEDKTYDMISSSISHWSMANSRKIFLLYQKNKSYMDILERNAKLFCTEEDIEIFVKYRNDITHGRYRTMDSVIARTSYTLMVLSYCCFLQRIGMQDAELQKLLEENKIGG